MFSHASGRTDVGNVRTNNEDNFICDPNMGLFAVCDGMGGHAAGEVASKMACEALAGIVTSLAKTIDPAWQSLPAPWLMGLRQDALTQMAALAHAMGQAGQANALQRGMGTTCTALWVIGPEHALVLHIGDSRLYLQTEGAIAQLTQDHTLVSEWVAQGVLSPSAAATHPQGHILARALGAASALPADCFILALGENDTFLLCSDGLHAYLPPHPQLGSCLADADADAALPSLMARAKALGGHDNLTGVVVRMGSRGPFGTGSNLPTKLALLRAHPTLAPLAESWLRQVAAMVVVASTDGTTSTLADAQGCHWPITGELTFDAPEHGPICLTQGGFYAAAPLGCTGALPTLTLQPHTQVMTLSPQALRYLIGQDPTLGAQLLDGLARAPDYALAAKTSPT